MRAELERVYQELFTNYIQRPRVFKFFPIGRARAFLEADKVLREINKEIATAEELHSSVTIRPDAKLFITMIFHQMVAVPIIIENFENNKTLVSQYIKEDVKNLLKKAAEAKAGADVKEVTAHTILSLLDEEWEELNISTIKLWHWSK